MESQTKCSTSASESKVDAGPQAASTAPPPPDQAPRNPAAEAFSRITHDAAELKEYAQYYIAAKIDSFRSAVKRVAILAGIGVMAAVAGCTVIAVAVGLVLVGIAEALGNLFGGRYWLADIVVGVVVLGALALTIWLMMKKLTGSWRSQTVKKYEERKQSQRERFGHDVEERAKSASEP